ncbi:MAG TPA: iron ABC transporter permease [Bordetella sp.]|jgi:iron(III) transport system permease protein|nr:iron ABC transporter permease [Bordetella sp.]
MKGFRYAVSIGALVLLALFLLYPLALVLNASLRVDGTGPFTLANYAGIFSSGYYVKSVGNSLIAAACATIGATVIGVPLAFCMARVDLPGKPLLFTLASLPLVLPSFVAAYALVLLFGHAGVITTALREIGIPIGSIYGLPGIIAVLSLTLYPYVLMPTMAGFKAIDISVEEAGRNLGGSRWHVFRTVLLPVVMPAVLAGALLVFIETLENFGVPAVLAEDRPFLAVDIFKLFAGEADNNPAAAGALSVLLIVCTALGLMMQRHYLSKRRFTTNARSAPPTLQLSRGWRGIAVLYSWGIVLLSLMPFVAVLFISFLRFRGPVLTWNLGLSNYAGLLAGSYEPLYNTLILATVAALVATVVGAPIGYIVTRHRGRLSATLDLIGMVPFAVSGTVMGVGLILAFNNQPWVLTGGWLILVIAYVVRKLPFSVRSAAAIVHQIEPSLEEASINLGVSPFRTFVQLIVPLMAGGLIGGMVLVWITVASELSSTIVLYTSRWSTITVRMYQLLEGTGAGLAAAAASILILFTAVPLLLLQRRMRRRDSPLM